MSSFGYLSFYFPLMISFSILLHNELQVSRPEGLAVGIAGFEPYICRLLPHYTVAVFGSGPFFSRIRLFSAYGLFDTTKLFYIFNILCWNHDSNHVKKIYCRHCIVS